jgi:hypothetical protein
MGRRWSHLLCWLLHVCHRRLGRMLGVSLKLWHLVTSMIWLLRKSLVGLHGLLHGLNF